MFTFAYQYRNMPNNIKKIVPTKPINRPKPCGSCGK